jgi:hypothetical protein
MTAYECPKHQTVQDGYCDGCVTYLAEHPANMFTTLDARADELQMWIDIDKLTVPFGDLQKRFEDMAGRGVWTHELARPEQIVEEIRRQQPATMTDALDKLPSDKQVIVVTTD